MRVSKELHQKEMLLRRGRQLTAIVQFERFYPAAASAKRKTDLNRKHRRMYMSPSFQKFVKAEQAKEAAKAEIKRE